MGISLGMIERMHGLGLFGQGGISILDVGSSNLYSASPAGIIAFLSSFGIAMTTELESFAARLAQGSAYNPVDGGANGAFVGELFEKAGFRYNAIDIADGYRTTILDLNHESAPQEFVDTFDLILNFGTTEHLLNQYNAFKVIHDSTKVGGYIVNSLPCVGYSDHGYFTYTPRCLFDLAGYNEYELVGFWFEGPGRNNDLYSPLRNYQSYFPVLSTALDEREITEAGKTVSTLNIPDIGLLMICRKVKARPFMGALECSTSVGIVPQSVTSGYEAGQTSLRVDNSRQLAHDEAPSAISDQIDWHDEFLLSDVADKLRRKFVSGKMGLEESLAFYNIIVETYGSFPLDWEYRILLLALEREPERPDLVQRMALVSKVMSRRC